MQKRPMNKILDTPRFLRVPEAAALLKVSSKYIYDAIAEGRGPPVCRFNKLFRIRVEDFDAWVNSHKQEKQNV